MEPCSVLLTCFHWNFKSFLNKSQQSGLQSNMAAGYDAWPQLECSVYIEKSVQATNGSQTRPECSYQCCPHCDPKPAANQKHVAHVQRYIQIYIQKCTVLCKSLHYTAV